MMTVVIFALIMLQSLVSSYRPLPSFSSSSLRLFMSAEVPVLVTHYEELSVPTLRGVSLIDITKGSLVYYNIDSVL